MSLPCLCYASLRSTTDDHVHIAWLVRKALAENVDPLVDERVHAAHKNLVFRDVAAAAAAAKACAVLCD